MKDDLILERYKYILDQKKELNKTTFTVVALFQALVAAAMVGSFSLIQAVTKKELSVEIGVYLFKWMSYAFLLLGIFCILMILGGIFSWIGYRNDEAKIELNVISKARPSPKWSDLFGWYETYIILAIIITEVGYLIAAFGKIIPYIAGIK